MPMPARSRLPRERGVASVARPLAARRLTRTWARRGTRPRAPRDRRYAWALPHFWCSSHPADRGKALR